MVKLAKADDREIQITAAKCNANDIYKEMCSLPAHERCGKLEEILEMTGIVDNTHPASDKFKLIPVTDELSDEGIEDLCFLLMDIKDEMLSGKLSSKLCCKKISKLAMYASPNAYMEFVA